MWGARRVGLSGRDNAGVKDAFSTDRAGPSFEPNLRRLNDQAKDLVRADPVTPAGFRRTDDESWRTQPQRHDHIAGPRTGRLQALLHQSARLPRGESWRG